MAHRAFTSTYYATSFPTGMCYSWVEQAYGFPPDGLPDAAAAWSACTHKHPAGPAPPAGAVVFWTGGSSGHGHVAISEGGGKIRSTDTRNGVYTPGSVGDGTIVEWTSSSLQYAGWSDYLCNTLVYWPDSPPPPPPPPPAPEVSERNMDMFILINRVTGDPNNGEWFTVTSGVAVPRGGDTKGDCLNANQTINTSIAPGIPVVQVYNAKEMAAWKQAIKFVAW